MSSLINTFNFASIKLSRMGEADIDATVAMINKAYSYQDKAKGRPRTDRGSLRQKMGETEFYVAKHAEKVVGCVYVKSQERAVHFGLLTVADSYRGKGLAAAMMAGIEAHSKSIGAERVELDYMSEAPWLKHYYEKYGYAENGQVTPWGTIDLIRMEKPVPPV
jgi:GNAT superfamily N-acetyltransferase